MKPKAWNLKLITSLKISKLIKRDFQKVILKCRSSLKRKVSCLKNSKMLKMNLKSNENWLKGFRKRNRMQSRLWINWNQSCNKLKENIKSSMKRRDTFKLLRMRTTPSEHAFKFDESAATRIALRYPRPPRWSCLNRPKVWRCYLKCLFRVTKSYCLWQHCWCWEMYWVPQKA